MSDEKVREFFIGRTILHEFTDENKEKENSGKYSKLVLKSLYEKSLDYGDFQLNERVKSDKAYDKLMKEARALRDEHQELIKVCEWYAENANFNNQELHHFLAVECRGYYGLQLSDFDKKYPDVKP